MVLVAIGGFSGVLVGVLVHNGWVDGSAVMWVVGGALVVVFGLLKVSVYGGAVPHRRRSGRSCV